jgi:hypothetical protein
MDEAQFVDEAGHVTMHGRVVGHTEPHRPGGGAAWAAWGLDAAGPPFIPPLGEADLSGLLRTAKRQRRTK